MTSYKASFDSLTKTLTILVIFLLLLIGQGGLGRIMKKNNSSPLLKITCTWLLPATILAACYSMSIREYRLDGNALIIKKQLGERKINISDIEEIRMVENGDMTGTIRVFGSGGFFGYYGRFYNSRLGYMTLYTTQRRNRVYIRIKNEKKIIISPDDISLVEKLRMMKTGNV